jgi:Trypsin
MRTLTALALAGLLTLVAAPQASAIIHGQPDGNRHPYVGMTFNDEFVCSGTLIAPRVFLTAGHCADFLKVPTQGQGWVTFREDGRTFPEEHKVAAAYTAPGFCNDDAFKAPPCPGTGVLGYVRNDVGVAILAEPVTMAHYGRLPRANLVSSLPMMTPVTPVGYGIRVRLRKYNGEAFQRFFTHSNLIQSNQPWSSLFYKITSNFGQNRGATCFGDSGGPDFLRSSRVVLGVHSFVINLSCAGWSGSARVDSPAMLAWIRSFM